MKCEGKTAKMIPFCFPHGAFDLENLFVLNYFYILAR